MSKKIYLILFIILCLEAWGVKLIPFLSASVWLILQIAYLLWGYIHWSRLEYKSFGKYYLRAFKWIGVGIILSMIPAWLYYDQSFFASIIAYRRQFLWLAIPVLLRIAPSEDDVIGALKMMVLLMWGVLILRMFAPSLLYIDADMLEKYQTTGYYGYILGFSLVVIPMYYYIGRIKDEGLSNIKTLFWIIICYAFLFAIKNRSILFSSSVVILIYLLRMRSRNKPIIIFLAVLAIGLFMYATSDAWMTLLNRTQVNIADENYNRNIAYTYFLTEANSHFLQYVFGNGFISTHTSPLVLNLHSRGIYNSDVGFIGFWNEFGILPIIAFIYMSMLAMYDKAVPSYVGMIGLTVLLCAPTISYYGHIAHSLLFIIMYYQICYFQNQSKLELKSREVSIDELKK